MIRQWFKRDEKYPPGDFTVINCMMPDHTVRRFKTCEYGCCVMDANDDEVCGAFEWSVADDQEKPLDVQAHP